MIQLVLFLFCSDYDFLYISHKEPT